LRKASSDGGRLKRIAARLGDAVTDSVLWPQIIHEIGFGENAKNAFAALPRARRGDAGLGAD
jgi:hypothetical protein